MKKLISLSLLILVAAALFAAFDPAYSDSLFYEKADYTTDKAYLEDAFKASADKAEQAEILWRMARNVLTVTDSIEKDKKDERLAGYGMAQELAEKSIELKPCFNSYHWQASAIGRIGQVNGPLNSLSKAKPMLKIVETIQNEYKADYTDSWYVLGIIYDALPGSPVSFGNNNYAISYMRRTIATQDNVKRSNLTNYLELAEQLWKRNWDADKRAKEFDKMLKKYEKETVPTDKMKYYEGQVGKSENPYYLDVAVTKISDREEALLVVKYALDSFEKRSNKLSSDIAKKEELVKFLDGHKSK